jgi:hypothetical protein
MGTSRNDRSPQTPPWKMALAVLGTPDVPVSRQNTEIWRAVAADRGEKLIRDFSNTFLANACRWVVQGLPVNEAVRRYNASTRHESGAGLTIEMGRRALARCAARKTDAVTFVAELFAEAVSYYASRDLPSYVAASGRVSNTSETIKLKESLRETTRRQVKGLGEPRLGARRWRGYISEVLKALQGGGGSI